MGEIIHDLISAIKTGYGAAGITGAIIAFLAVGYSILNKNSNQRKNDIQPNPHSEQNEILGCFITFLIIAGIFIYVFFIREK
ncbi:hypothetical protein V1389_06505 [Flavobacterium rakeshii]|uniref:hypothetical protein n=1 Tax=Flavobacterium rakeshii TaxID=1038845 RepID=UPI002E7AB73D|nr:hypothetical protein [Flavobacterium rakeshii]MEE1897977.1 hypothetical protein [Flavobacterium rakeshii]